METKVTRNTNCSDLFAYEDIEYACDICKRKIDILTAKRNVRRNLLGNISKRKQWQQSWLASYATHVNKTLLHTKVCNFLDVPLNFDVQNECKCSKGESNQSPHASKKIIRPTQVEHRM